MNNISTVFGKDEAEKYDLNVLPNELLVEIFTYLSYYDLKKIRFVCKRWYNLTRCRELMKKFKLIINRSNIITFYKCLVNEKEFASKMTYDTLEVQCLERSHKLEVILKSLAPAIHFLVLNDSLIFSILDVCMPDLEGLIVISTGHLKRTEIGQNKVVYSVNNQSILKWQIKKLYFELNKKSEESLLEILRLHANSLKHLEICLRSKTAKISEWSEIFALLRNLESLKISGASNYQWLKAFVDGLPNETILRHCDLSGVFWADGALLKQIVDKWSKSLQSLELMFCSALTDESIKHLSVLRDTLRSLNLSHCANVSAKGLLQGLVRQKNCVLKTLKLKNVHDLDAESMMLLVERLPQLTYLSLQNFVHSVTNSTLQNIFRYQTRLQNLKLDDCKSITNAGIVGFGLNPAPIRNLKGLQSLSLRNCRCLSNRALIEGLKFNELRKFALTHWAKMTSPGIKALVKNCPTLEDLTISNCGMIDDVAIYYIAKGLPRLRCLHVSNCINVTFISVSHMSKFCRSLEKLDIS